MNDSARHEGAHLAYICLGSNIRPVENLRSAVELLRERSAVLRLSSCWETEAVSNPTIDGIHWPNFLNTAALISTPLDPAALKKEVLAPIEQKLGRVRTSDKYAPRTIDLDLTIYDSEVLDEELWRRVHLALIFAELVPELKNPQTGEMLCETAMRLAKEHYARKRLDVVTG